VTRGAKVGEEFDFEFENRRDDLRQARARGETSEAAALNRIEQTDRIGRQEMAAVSTEGIRASERGEIAACEG